MKKQYKKQSSMKFLAKHAEWFGGVMCRSFSRMAALSFIAYSSFAAADVSLPNGTVNEYVEDMRVQALGGPVVIDRQYIEGRWEVNSRWKPAVYSGVPNTTGSCVTYPAIEVRERVYEGNGTAWTLENRYTIRAKDYFAGGDCEANRIKTLRWQDRNTGQWMEFERADNTQLQYQLVRYGDRNDNTVTLDYDTASQPDLANLTAGKVKYVRDKNGNILYTFNYTGNNLTEVQDNPSIIPGNTAAPRSVQYAYTSTSYKGQSYQTINQVTDVLGNITKYGINNGNLVSIEDAESTADNPRIRTYTYSADRVVKYADALGNETTYKYDYDRNKQEFYVRIDAPAATPSATEHLITENWYSRSGNLIRRDLNGKTNYLKSEIDTATRSYVITDGAGNRTKQTVDEYNNLIKSENADSSTVTATYSPVHGGMLSYTDELGVQTNYDYDANGNLIKATEAVGLPEERVTEYEVNTQGQITHMTRRGGSVTLPNGQVITSLDKSTLYTYDEYGNLIRVTDANGGITEYTFDHLGQVTQIKDPNNGTWLAEYDAMGNQLKQTNPLGYTKQQEFNNVGKLIAVIDQENNKTQLEYDSANKLVRQTNALGHSFINEYDNVGRLVSVLDALGNVSRSMQYDARGRLIATQDAAGNITQVSFDDTLDHAQAAQLKINNMINRLTYNNRNQLVKQSLMANRVDIANNTSSEETHVTSQEYDARKQLIKITNPQGNSLLMEYDGLGRLTKRTDALSGVTQFSYDTHNNVIAVTDANSNITQYEYDNNNQKIKETLPEGGVLLYEYDSVGNVVKSTDAKGDVISNTYDLANRRTKETHTSFATNSVERTIDYTYNKVGTLTAYTDNNIGHVDHQSHSVSYTVDALQRRTSQTVTVGNQSYTLDTTFDANNQKISHTWPGVDGSNVTINYSYNQAQQLKDIILPGAGNISIIERQYNLPSRILYPGGGLNELSYDGFGRLVETKYKSSTQQTLLQRQYQYDPVDNITRINTENSDVFLFEYDKLSRLTKADYPSGMQDEQYTYDPLGNRLSDINKPHPDNANGQWQYGDNGQLTQSATANSASFGSNSQAVSHSYDADGNLTQLATEAGSELTNPFNNQQYTYDAQNRPTEVKDHQGNLIASYQYDPYGQRIRKTIHRTLANDGTWQALLTPNTFSYFYADEGLIAEYQTAGQDLEATTPTLISSPKKIAQYGWIPNGVWGTNPIWVNTTKQINDISDSTVQAATYYYYQNDNLGTPQQLTDRDGNIVWQQKSTAFGETNVTIGFISNELDNTGSLTSATGAIANPLRLPGQYYDAETNTNYNYQRQYNPATGRYTQLDPIGLEGGFNRQAYVNQNPLKLIDPSGLTIYGGPAGSGYYSDRPPSTGCRQAVQTGGGYIIDWKPCQPPVPTPPPLKLPCEGQSNADPVKPNTPNPEPEPEEIPKPEPKANNDDPDCENCRQDFLLDNYGVFGATITDTFSPWGFVDSQRLLGSFEGKVLTDGAEAVGARAAQRRWGAVGKEFISGATRVTATGGKVIVAGAVETIALPFTAFAFTADMMAYAHCGCHPDFLLFSNY